MSNNLMLNIDTKFIVQKVKIGDVVEYDTEKFNSNNHWTNGVKPIDYTDKLEANKTNKWIDNFRSNYKKIIINDPAVIKWMISASEISSKTGKFTKLFDDEIDEFVDKNTYADIFNGTGYFVRTENVSLKYGQHKTGPYYNMRQIIESVVSCIDGHKPLYENTTDLTIYLLDWVNVDDYNEFRVFVNDNKITAVSQQNLYNVYDKLDNQQELINKLKLITNYFDENIRPVITHMSSYSYDFAIINNKIPYFIECNSFGKEYAAGSALFHWLLDENILYGDASNDIYFRYTVR